MTHFDAGIVVAMSSEMRHFHELADEIEPLSRGPWVTTRLAFGSKRVVTILAGIGIANAAAATEHALSFYSPTVLLNHGCAGAHRRDLLAGDVIVGERYVNQTMVRIGPEGRSQHVGFTSEAAQSVPYLEADATLLQLARSVCRTFPIAPWPGEPSDNVSNPRRDPKWFVGTVASADVWTQSPTALDALHQEHQSLCEDMEAAAIARVAGIHETPFLSIKDISNSEFIGTTDIDEFNEFPIDEVGKRSASVLANLIPLLQDGSVS